MTFELELLDEKMICFSCRMAAITVIRLELLRG
jgi:hypothetical protein